MLPSLEREVLEWEQKFKALDALDELRDKVVKLKHEMAWAFVCEKEKVSLFWHLLYSLVV